MSRSLFNQSLAALSPFLFSAMLHAGSITDHGPAAPVGQAAWSGSHAVTTANGERMIAIQLWTGAGAENRLRRLLLVDAATGASEIFLPPRGAKGQGSFATFLSSKNRFYNIIGGEQGGAFYEFDLNTRQWTFTGDAPARFAHSFTEDDRGTIYAGMMPKGELLALDPGTRKIVNHGPFLKRNWPIYPELSTDAVGWVYAAILFKEANLIGFHPKHGMVSLLPAEKQVAVRGGKIHRAANGKVYARFEGGSWYELFDGKLAEVSKPGQPIRLHRQGWREWRDFGDGTVIETLSVPNKEAVIREKDGSERKIAFKYDSTGGPIMSIEAGPDGKIYGSTGIPLRFYRFDPATGVSENWGLGGHGGHINDLAVLKGKIYGAVYSNAELLEIDLKKPWTDAPMRESTNPILRFAQSDGVDVIGRPFAVLAHPDGVHVLVSGNPARAKEGGGLLIYNTDEWRAQLLMPEQLVPSQGIASLAALPDGTVIGGTTVSAATGGVAARADDKKSAMLFIMDWKTRTISDRISPGRFQTIADLVVKDESAVYGVATASGTKTELFRYDSVKKKIVERVDLSRFGALSGSQAPRVMTMGPDGKLYILFRKGIVSVNPATAKADFAVESEVPISAGAAWQGNRLYFAREGDLCSWSPFPEAGQPDAEQLSSTH